MAVSWPVQQGIYTAFCGLGALVAYFPLYWHLESWNSASVLWIFWSGTSCLIHFINAIIWHDNADNVAPVWCDISSRWMHVESIGIITAGALLNHRLYKLLKLGTECRLDINKKGMVIFDVCIGLGVPAVFMALYWFVQGHRFDIFGGIGCTPTAILTPIQVLIFGMWPAILCLVSAVYGVMTLRHFLRHRRNINDIISRSSERFSNLTDSRYIRLMLFASLDACLMLPFNIFALVYTMVKSAEWYPYRGLADLHYNFSRVRQYPAVLWRLEPGARFGTFLVPGTAIGSSFIFFIFFGLSHDARAQYRRSWAAIHGRFGRHFKCMWPCSWLSKLSSRVHTPEANIPIPIQAQKQRVMRGRVLDTSLLFAHTATVSIDIGGVNIAEDDREFSEVDTKVTSTSPKPDSMTLDGKN
ncbi:mating-type-like pheromone receptor [Phlebiopsis gigantea 11061_1 CR5-6]|uniref:Mating-type-like pheromone receptor n=1 Tax=Phlebiopsis gigantea (strain 11061_1 CR5-6) TaxID=745531 RepID=A0A0C3RXQ3_PHLG1|nr:mating-type-like pheromone receptor [Phlebiopsis gigantea 11061_1 CR5-6]